KKACSLTLMMSTSRTAIATTAIDRSSQTGRSARTSSSTGVSSEIGGRRLDRLSGPAVGGESVRAPAGGVLGGASIGGGAPGGGAGEWAEGRGVVPGGGCSAGPPSVAAPPAEGLQRRRSMLNGGPGPAAVDLRSGTGPGQRVVRPGRAGWPEARGRARPAAG